MGSVNQVQLDFMLLFTELGYWLLVRQHLELHPLELRFQRHLNLLGAQSPDPVFGSWMTAGLWACLTCCKLGSMAAYHTLVGASCSSQSPSTEPRIPEIPTNKSRLLSFPLFQTWEQDHSIHQKRMVHLPPLFSLGILPRYFVQAPLLLRCSLSHLERNLPPELTPRVCSLMDTHLQVRAATDTHCTAPWYDPALYSASESWRCFTSP